MSGLQINVTPEGRAAIVNAENTGTDPVLVAEIGISTTATGPVGGALDGEIKRLVTFSGQVVAPDTIHVTIRDDSSDAYSMRAFALYLDDGTLFAWYAQAEVLLEKSSQAMLLLAADVIFSNINAASITFGDTNWLNPPATTEVLGVVELATAAEAAAGTDTQRAMTPAGAKAAMDGRLGAGAPTAFAKALLGMATAALIRGALELKSAALKDAGAGNGLDADLLDGQHGDYYLAWANLTGKPASYPPGAHQHTVSDISDFPAAIAPKADKADTLTHAGFIGAGADLDSYTSTGIYHQSNNTNAAGGLNYPAPYAGMLQVYAAAAMVYQTYQHYSTGVCWNRTRYNDAWSPWRLVWDSGQFDPATKADVSHGHAAGDISSGTFANARIAVGNVTQHQASLSIAWGQLTGVPAYGTRWPAWGEVSGKPATFTPSAHTHATLTPGSYLSGSSYDGGTARTWSIDADVEATGGKVVVRDGSGDIKARLFRMEYASNNANIGHFVTLVETGSAANNYMRPSTPAQAKAALNIGIGDVSGLQAALNGKAPSSNADFGGYIRINGGPQLTDYGSANTLQVTTANGYVRIGPSNTGYCHFYTGAPAYYFDHQVQAVGGFKVYSSRRTKVDVRPIDYGLAELRQIQAVSYRYRAKYAGGERLRKRLGLIAEDLAEIISEPVFESTDGDPPALDYDQLIPVLIRAVQELDAEVRELRSRVA